MENPIIVLAAVAVAFGVINIVLWIFLTKNDKKIDHHNSSLLAGHEFMFGRFEFSQQLGIYIYCPFEQKEDFYQRAIHQKLRLKSSSMRLLVGSKWGNELANSAIKTSIPISRQCATAWGLG